jgi:hypothetical protein
VSHATNSVSDALTQLADALERRCAGQRLPEEIEVVRTPVALMFVRGDRAEPGKTLAEQVVSSFGYWNSASAEYLDLVFFGWYKESSVGFQPIKRETAPLHPSREAGIFIDCCREIERMSKWRYSGETDVLLVDFEMRRTETGQLCRPGTFSFKNSIYLPVEKMIDEKRVRSLDALVHELVEAAREVYEASPLQGTVFEMSDRVAWTRGRRAVWDRLKHLFLRDWSKVYDELRPFAVCNLSVREPTSFLTV